MELIKQKYNFAIIDLIRDNCLFDSEKYSGLDVPKPIKIDDEENNLDVLDDLFSDTDFGVTNDNSFEIKPLIKNKKFETIKLEPKPTKGAKTKYFYNDGEKEYVSFQKLTEQPFYTTKNRHIKKHYINPFASIELYTYERTVHLENGKLYVRSYKQRRWRNFNWKYFRKTSKVETLSIDLDKGNFIIGDINNTSRTKTKRFRKNSFGSLEVLLTSHHFFNKRTSIPKTGKNDNIFNEFDGVFNDGEILKVLSEYIPNIPINLGDVESKNKFLKVFIDFFVEKKKIKVPNDYINLIKRYYPTEKFLKKNDRKLIQSILDSFGINSKLTNKIMHENSDINLQELSAFCSLFGKDFPKYIGSLPSSVFNIFKNKNATYYGTAPMEQRGVKNNWLFIENFEKENIIKIINSVNEKNPNTWAPLNNLYTLFKDHFEMIDKLREYDPNLKMRATTYDDFHIEHLELSKMVRLIKKAWTIEYQFDNRMVRLVEEEIKYLHKDYESYVFKPQILKREEEYSEEGSFMHHCVATYANKESSIIISLRTGGGSDRVTCEFNKKTGECLQERHFCNKVPPEHFEQPLKILKERVRKFANQRLLNHIDIKKVRVKINGKEVKQEDNRSDVEILFDNVINGIEF